MKNKYLYIKISFISTIVLSIIFWIFFFFIPTNTYIYNSNTKIKELKRIVSKYKKDKSKFNKSDIIEANIIKHLTKQFNNKFYIVKTKEDMIMFFRKIYSHIQFYEKKKDDKIIDLQITTETEKKLSGRYRQAAKDDNKKADTLLLKLIPKLESKTITLTFNGNIKDVLNFTNHITWSDQFISIKELDISKKFKLILNAYYINDRVIKNEQ